MYLIYSEYGATTWGTEQLLKDDMDDLTTWNFNVIDRYVHLFAGYQFTCILFTKIGLGSNVMHS